jgi:hypothetical protein
MTTEVTYDNGVATIIGRGRKTEINVLVTAQLGVGGQLDRVSVTDVRALSAGYLALAGELKLARSGGAPATPGALVDAIMRDLDAHGCLTDANEGQRAEIRADILTRLEVGP